MLNGSGICLQIFGVTDDLADKKLVLIDKGLVGIDRGNQPALLRPKHGAPGTIGQAVHDFQLLGNLAQQLVARIIVGKDIITGFEHKAGNVQ